MLSIPSHRKVYLINVCRLIFVNIPKHIIKGEKGLAQLAINRVESTAKNPDEFSYMIDVITVMIRQSKDKEIQIRYKGKPINKDTMKQILKTTGLELNNQIRVDDKKPDSTS